MHNLYQFVHRTLHLETKPPNDKLKRLLQGEHHRRNPLLLFYLISPSPDSREIVLSITQQNTGVLCCDGAVPAQGISCIAAYVCQEEEARCM